MWPRLRPVVRDLFSDALHVSRLTHPQRAARGLLTVVTFHRVLPPDLFEDYPLREIAVTTDEFEWFVAFFKKNFTVCALLEAYRRWNLHDRPRRPLLAITFDDGQADNYRYARPILERSGLLASFFVPVDAVQTNGTLWHDRLAFAADRLLKKDGADARGRFAEIGLTSHPDDHQTVLDAVERAKSLPDDRREAFVAGLESALGGPARAEWDGMMTWAELREMAKAGHEIGSHSMSHGILPLLDDDSVVREIQTSREILETQLDAPIDTFCYPNGDYDDRALAAVRRAGYRLAVTTKWGPNGLKGSAVRPYELSRVDVQGQHARSRDGKMSEARMAWRLSRYFSGPNG